MQRRRATTSEAEPFLACFARQGDSRGLLSELQQIRDAGQDVGFRALTGQQIRSLTPALTTQVSAAVEIFDQRYLHPPQFIASLADAVRTRGGRIIEDSNVTDIQPESAGVSVTLGSEQHQRHDAAGYHERRDRELEQQRQALGRWACRRADPHADAAAYDAQHLLVCNVCAIAVPSNIGSREQWFGPHPTEPGDTCAQCGGSGRLIAYADRAQVPTLAERIAQLGARL